MLSFTLLLPFVQWALVGHVLAQTTVPSGPMIYSCTVPDTIALTFDDGPSPYTTELLDILAEFDARATFFIIGNKINDARNTGIVQLILEAGHQIGSHTEDHPHLPQLGYEEIKQQMFAFEDSFQSVTNQIPMYMRPPYLETSADVESAMSELGYHVIGADIDTKDYEFNSPELIWYSFQKFLVELDYGGSIVLAHDTEEQTVVSLARQMLETIRERGLRATTVGACLGQPESTWYRSYV